MAKVLSNSQHAKPQLDPIYSHVHFPAIWLIQDLWSWTHQKSPLSTKVSCQSPSIKDYMHCFLCILSKLKDSRFLFSIEYLSLMFPLLEIIFLSMLPSQVLYDLGAYLKCPTHLYCLQSLWLHLLHCHSSMCLLPLQCSPCCTVAMPIERWSLLKSVSCFLLPYSLGQR
jgi:hypothetical protein